jgi:hypothetical protein
MPMSGKSSEKYKPVRLETVTNTVCSGMKEDLAMNGNEYTYAVNIPSHSIINQ